MDSFIYSPLFALVPFVIGLLIGWLVRESMLLSQFNARLAQIDRDRDFARTEAETLREQVSLLEADAKKAAFDNQEISDRLALADADRNDIQKVIRDQKTAADVLKKEKSALNERIIAQDELVEGLRARIGKLSDQAENFTEKEGAEKRLHEDLAAAVEKVASLEKQLEKLATLNTKIGHEKESLKTQLLDYQLQNAEMPGLLAGNNANGSPKNRNKKSAEQPVAAPQNGPSNGESNGASNGESKPQKPAPVLVDDLKIINTITPAQESELANLGITTIEQLAKLSANQLLEIAEGSSKLAKKMQKEDWVGQAKHVLATA